MCQVRSKSITEVLLDILQTPEMQSAIEEFHMYQALQDYTPTGPRPGPKPK